MRTRQDLSGYWHGRLELAGDVDVAVPGAPAAIERDFFVPLSWNKQIDHLRWPGPETELSGVVRPVQNQNFREVMRKFNEGTITYRRLVEIPDEPQRRLPARCFLVFEGSNYRTGVHVNGQSLGVHDGGHLRFEFDVTEAIQVGGANRFDITVDNLRRKDACPQEQFNWQNYGGIYRPIYLEWRPEVFIAGWGVTPGRDAAGWFADVSVRMSGVPTAAVTVQITSGGERQRLSLSGAKTTLAGRLRLENPLLWQPGTGGLSHLQIAYPAAVGFTDRIEASFGFRTVALRGGRVEINGRPVRILGAAWHEQHPAFGNSVPAWQVTRDIQLMKHVGLNAIRAAHYPHSQAFYEAADREGMLVVPELPCWQFNGYHFEQASVREFCCRMAGEMVEQLGHHPSIIGWLIQNESQTFEPGAAEFFGAIARAFKEADGSRFTLTAESPRPPEHLAVVKMVEGRPSGPLPPTHVCADVLGVNNYAGWYAEKSDFLPQLLDHVHGLLGERPMIVTEFGAEGILGQRSLEMHPWTEDYQAELICRHMRAILARDFVAGFFLWLFIDYEAASISIRAINAKGLVDEYRRPKLAFNQVRQLLAEFKDGLARD